MTPIRPPMTDERLDRLVRQLLTERADDVATVAMPAETMAAVVASHVRRNRIADRRAILLVAAALLVVLAAGAVAVGSGLFRDSIRPEPTPLPVVPGPDEPSPTPSEAARAQRVFYTDYRAPRVGEAGCTEASANRFGTCISSKIVVADSDGSDPRELLPDDQEPRTLVAVSTAGDSLVFYGPAEIDGRPIGASHLAELGPDGSVLPTRVVSDEVLDEGCEGLCASDAEFAFSPDGTRLAYVRSERQGDEDYETVIALQDVASGEVLELESTRTSGTGGLNSTPRWSPDGSQILFAREGIGPTSSDDRIADTATFVVDSDGSNLRQLVPTELFARDGAWSPDGETIAFTSAIAWLGVDPSTGKRELFNEDSDVYTVRADGTDLRRLTTFAPNRQDRGTPVQEGGRVEGWTRDGQIVFSRVRWAGVQGDSTALPPEIWVMDTDGSDAVQIDGTNLAALTAAGCVDCPYPPLPDDPDLTAFWRPIP